MLFANHAQAGQVITEEQPISYSANVSAQENSALTLGAGYEYAPARSVGLDLGFKPYWKQGERTQVEYALAWRELHHFGPVSGLVHAYGGVTQLDKDCGHKVNTGFVGAELGYGKYFGGLYSGVDIGIRFTDLQEGRTYVGGELVKPYSVYAGLEVTHF